MRYHKLVHKLIVLTFVLLSFLFITSSASAHEAYVLTHAEFVKGLSTTTPNPLAPLLDPAYIRTCALITICVIIAYLLVIIFSASAYAASLDKIIKKARFVGPLIIRVAISASFFYAAMDNSILGPELSLNAVAFGSTTRFLLFGLSIMILFGFLTELAALTGLIIFFLVASVFGGYMITYANYFGELIVLFLFGSRFLSIDALLFGQKLWIKKLEEFKYLEIPIVRILYGIALMYAGWSIKFVHESLSVSVYNQYHLVNFFHASAPFIAAGAGLSEIMIGFFILIGFAQRLTTLISLFFITISLLYFREMLWPHLMLYGISFSIFINSADKFTIDHYLPSLTRRLLWPEQIKKRTKKK